MTSTTTAYACRPLSNPIVVPNSSTMSRVMAFDPTEVYRNLGNLINHFSRIQGHISMERMWPQSDISICSCGCGAKLSGRRYRWATNECSIFANHVFMIIYGKGDLISRYMQEIAGHYAGCMKCGIVWTYEMGYHGNKNHVTEVDHILPVIQGGGGCWLSNYQQICIPCHLEKTKSDAYNLRLWKKNPTDQITLL